MPALTPIRYGSSPEGTPKRPLVAGRSGGVTPDDPDWAFVVLSLRCDGSDNNLIFTDLSSHLHGNASIQGNAKVNDQALRVVTDGDFIFYNDNADWQLATANADEYCVELQVKFNTILGSRAIIGQSFVSGTFAWILGTNVSGTEISFSSSNNGTAFNATVTTSGANLVVDTYYDVAVSKDSTGKIRVYVGTAELGSVTPVDSSIFDSSWALTIGGISGGQSIDGWIKNVRITKGADRYNTNPRVVPSTPYPTE